MRAGHLLPKQVKIIQTLRGLSALAVVIAHLWHGQKEIIIHPSLNYLSKAGAYGVHVFFIISGFILLYSLHKHQYSIKSYARFIVKRLIRLEPAFILSILLVLFCASVLSPLLDVPFESLHRSPRDLLLHLLYLVPFVEGSYWAQGVYWTLAVEFQFYILIGLLAALFLKNSLSKYVKHLLLAVCMLASFIEVGNNAFLLPWMSFFGVGMAAFLKVTDEFNWIDFGVQMLLACGINYFVFENFNFLAILILVPLLIIFLLDYEKMPFQILGKISYSLYLVHGSTGILMTRYCIQYFSMGSIGMQMLALLIGVFFSIFFAFLLYRIGEKPFVKLSKRIRL